MSHAGRNTWGLLLIATAGIMEGCAVGPDYHAPPPPPEAAFSPVQDPTGGRDIPFKWWELFQSEPLDAMIETALKANPTIAAARATLSQAQELMYAQRGAFYPSVGATYQAERHKVSGNTNSSSTIGVQGNGVNLLPQREDPNHFPHNKPSYYTFYTAELTVGFEPDVFGGNRRQVESLAALADVQRFALEAAYITLASNVAAAAIQEASLRAQIKITQAIIEVDQQVLQILRDQFRLGFVMRIDVTAQEAALAQVSATLPPLQKQLEQTRDLLRAMLGALPSHADETFELDSLRLPPDVPSSLPARLLEQRPDIRAAAAQLHASNAQIGVAIAAMLPQLSIDGQYGGNATRLRQMFSAGGPFWSLYGDMTQPVFQGGMLLHRQRAAKNAFKQAAAQYQNTVLVAYRNVADALHVTASDAATLTAAIEAENAAKVTYDLTLRQLQAGYVACLTSLSAQSAYEQTLLPRVQAEAARYSDTVALFQALGGGWWNRTPMAAQ